MYLGIGLANLINLIDPQIIVIAGGAVNGWDLFAEEMYRQVDGARVSHDRRSR
jgi:predicted NBD/HSP70 family sugar kinase